jgi:hypothetical protein
MSDWNPLHAVLFACALLIAPAMTVYDGWTYMRLVRDGVTATAVVTYKNKTTSRNSTSYHVDYTFRDETRRKWSGSQRIDHQLYARLRVGQPLQIVYCRSNPDVNVAYMQVLRERVAFLSFVSLVIALLAGGLAWWWHYAQSKTREHDAAMRLPAA